jgi:hypothetical protein
MCAQAAYCRSSRNCRRCGIALPNPGSGGTEFERRSAPIRSLSNCRAGVLSVAVSRNSQKQGGGPHGLSIAHDSLDSGACVCWLLIVGWQELGLAGPGCLCNASRGSSGISSSSHVHNQATSASETSSPVCVTVPVGVRIISWTYGCKNGLAQRASLSCLGSLAVPSKRRR